MDPLSLLTAAAALLGAEAAKKCGGLVAEQAFAAIKEFFKGKRTPEPRPEDFTRDRLREIQADTSPTFVQPVRAVIARSSALRRAQLVRPALEGARILWVDDRPQNIAYESRSLAALGINVEFVSSTEEALARVARTTFDVILSDMARARPDDGLVLLRRLRESGCPTEVVFYVGQLDRGRGVPVGAFGITNQPEPLLHYVFDVLERRRV